MSEASATDSPAPPNPSPTLDDFRQCGWKSVANGKVNGSELFHAFNSASHSATAAGQHGHARALTILADVSGMMLVPDNAQVPFRALMSFGDRRSALPEDFTSEQVDILAQFVAEVDHPFLQARIADVVWLLKRPRDPKFAHTAIDAYSKFPISKESWHHHETGKALGRALRLAGMLKAKDRVDAIKTLVLTAFDKASIGDGFLAIWIARLLEEHGIARKEAGRIATHLDSLAQEFMASGNEHQAMEYSDAASGWYRKAGQNQNSTVMLVRVADALEKQAAARTGSAPATPSIVFRNSQREVMKPPFFKRRRNRYRSRAARRRRTS